MLIMEQCGRTNESCNTCALRASAYLFELLRESDSFEGDAPQQRAVAESMTHDVMTILDGEFPVSMLNRFEELGLTCEDRQEALRQDAEIVVNNFFSNED